MHAPYFEILARVLNICWYIRFCNSKRFRATNQWLRPGDWLVCSRQTQTRQSQTSPNKTSLTCWIFTDERTWSRTGQVIPSVDESSRTIQQYLHTILWAAPVIRLMGTPVCVCDRPAVCPYITTLVIAIVQTNPEVTPACVVPCYRHQVLLGN